MTFKGAFQSFQTVLVLCADTPGRSWVRARPASPAAPAPPPQCCGVQHLAAQVLPTQWIHCPWSLVPSHPNLPLENCGSSCSAGLPLPGEGLFLWPWTGSLGLGSCWDCVFRKQHLLLWYFSTRRRVQAEESPREWWQESPRVQSCWEHPGPARGDPSAFSSSESLQGPLWHWGPVGPSGCSRFPPCSC